MNAITWPKISRLLGYQTYNPDNINSTQGIIEILTTNIYCKLTIDTHTKCNLFGHFTLHGSKWQGIDLE